jgi:hypothetical protein
MRILALTLLGTLLAGTAAAQDADRSVADGGIKISGWQGRVDRRPMSQGKTINDSRLVAEGANLRLSVGPAGNFWNAAHTASGDYEVKATFKEHKMAASHPHSYGIFIGGADLQSDTETLAYCIVYGTGTFSVKTFHGDPPVTTLVDRQAHAAINKADANGEATNTIGWRVQGNTAACVVNGTAVHTFQKSELIGPDKITSTDGIYGLRVSHNLELTVSGLAKTGR